MWKSHNKTISFVYRYCLADKRSFITRNLFYIYETFKCHAESLAVVKRVVKTDLTEDQMRKSEFLRELLNVRDGIMFIDGIDIENVNDIIDFISTS